MKIKYYILLLSILALTACKNDVDQIWDDLPSVRAEKARKELSNVLTSSENGWIVAYYTDPTNFGAYNFLMKFDGENVDMQGDELFPKGVHSSLYSVSNIQGPTLVFSTYNIISQLADPLMFVPGSGLNGDNEFVWQSTEKDKNTITFKGKKSGSVIKFIRYNGNWNQHFQDIQKMTDLYTTGSMDRYFKELVMEDGSQILLCGYDAVKRTINPVIQLPRVIPTPETSDSIVQVINGVNITTTGINFHDPFKVSNQYVQNLVFDESTGYFKVADEGVNAFVRPVDEPTNIVFNNSNTKVLNNKETYQFMALDSRLSQIESRIGAKISNYYGVYLHPLDALTGHYISFLYVKNNALSLGAYVKINTTKNQQRSDKVLLKSALSITVGGEFASLVKDDCIEFIKTIVGDDRKGRNYIVIPQEDGNYTLGCSEANVSFTIAPW